MTYDEYQNKKYSNNTQTKGRYDLWKESQEKTYDMTNQKNETLQNLDDNNLIKIQFNNNQFCFTKLEIILLLCIIIFILFYVFIVYKKILKRRFTKKDRDNL